MTDDPQVGRDCSGWVIERKIGQGGMGSVYLARRPADGDRVVVKFLAEEQAQNPTWRGRFLREARVMAQVQHENIVGVHAVVEDEVPYIVMEFVDGSALDELLTKQGALPAGEAARVTRDIARGLAHAHARNVIHRDIKPANVLLTREGAVKVLDFGLAKSVTTDDGLSMAGQVLGTPHYMAPEQWGDHQVDARADVFELGASLYQLVTNALPFPGATPLEISSLSRAGSFTWPRALADLPEDLELVILRALVPDRLFRYPSAQAMADDLQRVLDGVQVEAPCLVGPDGLRRPLLPGGEFTVGSDPESSGVLLDDPSVAPQHATLLRTPSGWVVRDLGTPGGTAVGGTRTVKDVLLKEGDEVRFGEAVCTYRDGGLAEQLRAMSQARPTERVPAYLFETLLRLSDRRCVLALIEELDRRPHAARLDAARAELGPVFGEEVTEVVVTALEKGQRKALARLPGALFSMTHENLGPDVGAWLAWWEQVQGTYPGQVVAALPGGDAALRVSRGEPEVRDVLLPADVPSFAIGRDEASAVVVQNRSVSRLHATIRRLHRRLVVRDEGSRLGIFLNGERVQSALLESGDTLSLGDKVDLVFGGAPPVAACAPEDPEDDTVWVDPDVYVALEAQRHPSTVVASLRFADLVRDEDFIGAGATALFPEEADRPRAAEALAKVFEKRAVEARKVLEAILGPDPGDGWAAAYEQASATLPTQAVPLSWFGGPGC